MTISYKFSWLPAILDTMRAGGAATVAIDDLVARRVAAVWVPSNYIRLSFGKQAKLGEAARSHAHVELGANQQADEAERRTGSQ